MPSFRRHSRPWDEKTPDENLVRLVQHGHHEAFGEIYDRYRDNVYGYCYRLIGNHEGAEDATSSVFSNALAALPKFRESSGAGAFRRWLFTIAHNVLVDDLKKRRETRSIDEVEWLLDSSPSVEEIAIASDQRNRVLKLLPLLSEDQRHVFALRMSGLNAAEIGEILGRPRNAIDGLSHRAVIRLQELVATGSGSTVTGGRGHD